MSDSTAAREEDSRYIPYHRMRRQPATPSRIPTTSKSPGTMAPRTHHKQGPLTTALVNHESLNDGQRGFAAARKLFYKINEDMEIYDARIASFKGKPRLASPEEARPILNLRREFNSDVEQFRKIVGCSDVRYEPSLVRPPWLDAVGAEGFKAVKATMPTLSAQLMWEIQGEREGLMKLRQREAESAREDGRVRETSSLHMPPPPLSSSPEIKRTGTSAAFEREADRHCEEENEADYDIVSLEGIGLEDVPHDLVYIVHEDEEDWEELDEEDEMELSTGTLLEWDPCVETVHNRSIRQLGRCGRGYGAYENF